MKLAISIAATVAGALPAKAAAVDHCQTAKCNERVAAHQCSNARPRRCVERAILTYHLHGWQSAWMRRIPGCESHWNPLAYYSMQVAETRAEQRYAEAHDLSGGLYSFKPSTWRRLARYGHLSMWQAKWNALGAALMVRQNRTGEWACR